MLIPGCLCLINLLTNRLVRVKRVLFLLPLIHDLVLLPASLLLMHELLHPNLVQPVPLVIGAPYDLG
jgi:hypothetical protein